MELVVIVVAVVVAVVLTVVVMNRRQQAAIESALAKAEAERPPYWEEGAVLALCQQAFSRGAATAKAGALWEFEGVGVVLRFLPAPTATERLIRIRGWVFGEEASYPIREEWDWDNCSQPPLDVVPPPQQRDEEPPEWAV